MEWKHIVLFISHDETLIERTANMVIHIEQIKRKTEARYTVAKLPYRNYVEERLHNLNFKNRGHYVIVGKKRFEMRNIKECLRVCKAH